MRIVESGRLGPRRVLSIAELVGGVRELVEELGPVWVVGEISNLRRAGSGHAYFTLKDDDAQLRAVLFRGNAVRLPFDPEEGLEVIAGGELTVYGARGDLQLIVRQLEPRGRGALQLAFEQLRARLEAEGLFADERKRELPRFPRRVGVVTSPSGAALHDVIHVTGRRFPATPLLLAPTRVQGEGAEDEIAGALARLARVPDVDVILLVRGGGSLEDLMAFNTERVARAIRSCPVPVIAGVGHEVDITIADLAADARAATPSAAAQLALPDRGAVAGELDALLHNLMRAALGNTRELRRDLSGLARALRAQAPTARLAARRVRLAGLARSLLVAGSALARARRASLAPLSARLGSAARRVVPERRARLGTGAARLDALSPLAVLGRGYALARGPHGEILRDARRVAVGDELTLRLARGSLSAAVTGVRGED
ncbi:MAG TPA: exodeoxyribonuclease VII large subunit [Myxococcota bacterium]